MLLDNVDTNALVKTYENKGDIDILKSFVRRT